MCWLTREAGVILERPSEQIDGTGFRVLFLQWWDRIYGPVYSLPQTPTPVLMFTSFLKEELIEKSENAGMWNTWYIELTHIKIHAHRIHTAALAQHHELHVSLSLAKL